MCNNKPQTYAKKAKTLENNKKYELNNVDKRNKNTAKPQRKFTKLIDIVDNILNVLIKEDFIKLLPILEPKFPNGVPKNIRYEEFCNYHMIPEYLIRNYRVLRNII